MRIYNKRFLLIGNREFRIFKIKGISLFCGEEPLVIRSLIIYTRSEEEKYDLGELFESHGFKITYSDFSRQRSKKSIFFRPTNLPENILAAWDYRCAFYVYESNTLTERFPNFLDILSREYQYKTLWAIKGKDYSVLK